MKLEYDQFKQLLSDYCKENNLVLDTTHNTDELRVASDVYCVDIMLDWSKHDDKPVMHFDFRIVHKPGCTDHIISFDIYQDVELFKRTLVDLDDFARETVKQTELYRNNIKNSFEVSAGTTITHFYY